MFQVKQKTWLITAASTGFGRAVWLLLSAEFERSYLSPWRRAGSHRPRQVASLLFAIAGKLRAAYTVPR